MLEESLPLTIEQMTPEQLMDEYNAQVADFFETELIKDIKLEIYDSKQDLSDRYQEINPESEMPDYVVGFSPGNIIAILSRDIMPADSETLGPERFDRVLRHEITHKYVAQLNKHTPDWLDEGTSCYVAEQNKGKLKQGVITISLLNELTKTTDGRIYSVGKNMVDRIIEEYGKTKLFELIAIPDNKQRNNELKKLFDWLN